MTRHALILFAHGARDPAWATPFRRLEELVAATMPQISVSLAFLDLMPPSLPERVADLTQQGHIEITIVPVFLGQGGHVAHDLPLIVEQLRQTYPAVTLHVAKAAGEADMVLQALAQYCISQVRLCAAPQESKEEGSKL